MNSQASSGPGSHLTLKTHSEKLPAGRLTPHKVCSTQSAALFPLWPATQQHTGAFRWMRAGGQDWWEGHTLELCIELPSPPTSGTALPPPRSVSLLSTHTPLRHLAPELHLFSHLFFLSAL